MPPNHVMAKFLNKSCIKIDGNHQAEHAQNFIHTQFHDFAAMTWLRGIHTWKLGPMEDWDIKFSNGGYWSD